MARQRNRIRLALDIRSPLTASLDVFRSATPAMPRARALQVEVALFDGSALDDISDLQSVTLEVKKLATDNPALMSKTMAAGVLNPGLNLDLWNAGKDSDSHAMFTFVEGETGLDLGGTTYGDFVLVITGLSSIGNLTLGTTTLRVVLDGGLTSANTPAAGDAAYVRVDQLNAIVANFVKVQGDAGVPQVYKSHNGVFLRRVGISDTGVRIDEISKVG